MVSGRCNTRALSSKSLGNAKDIVKKEKREDLSEDNLCKLRQDSVHGLQTNLTMVPMKDTDDQLTHQYNLQLWQSDLK